MLIGPTGEKEGLVDFTVAFEKAKATSLDLVQVSPMNAEPVVCKLLDYGKHLFDKKKNDDGVSLERLAQIVKDRDIEIV